MSDDSSVEDFSISTRNEFKALNERLSMFLKQARVEPPDGETKASGSQQNVSVDAANANRNNTSTGLPSTASSTFASASTNSSSVIDEAQSCSSSNHHKPSFTPPRRPHSSLSRLAHIDISKPDLMAPPPLPSLPDGKENVSVSLSSAKSERSAHDTYGDTALSLSLSKSHHASSEGPASSARSNTGASLSFATTTTDRRRLPPANEAVPNTPPVLTNGGASDARQQTAVRAPPTTSSGGNISQQPPSEAAPALCATPAPSLPVDTRAAATNASSSVTSMASTTADPTAPQQQLKPRKTMFVNGTPYQILNLLGKGGSSKVYQVFDEKTESCLAVKVVDLADETDEVRKAYENEIQLLQRLQKSDRVVRLYAFERKVDEDKLYVVMEKGDTDLATFLKRRRQEPLADKMVAFYWLEMLRAVQVIHAEGIVHSDLKPSNFLLVGGHLKLIDFGIASTIPNNKTAITKECQMGTLSYMSPEAIKHAGSEGGIKFRIPLKSDVWSLGCILYSMIYGRTPFQQIGNTYGKMLAITDERHRIAFDSNVRVDGRLMDVMKKCLQRRVELRPTTAELLNHPYIQSLADDKQPDAAAADAKPMKAVDESQLLTLGATLACNTPRTNAKMLKRMFAGGLATDGAGDDLKKRLD